jgi:hypothetical protein
LKDVAGSVYSLSVPSGSGPFDFSPQPQRKTMRASNVSPFKVKRVVLYMIEGSPERTIELKKNNSLTKIENSNENSISGNLYKDIQRAYSP